jgi:hypothetical protein
MTAGKGYIIRAPDGYPSTGIGTVFQGSFLGVPNNGLITVPSQGGTANWNLLGNPYPSALDANKFLRSDVDSLKTNKIYLGDNLSYITGGVANVTLNSLGYINIHADSDSTTATESLNLFCGSNQLKVYGGNTRNSALTFNGQQVWHSGNAGGELTSDLLPATDGLNIGSSTQRWNAIYVDEAYLSTNTLYIGDTPVMGTDADTIIIKADPDQSIAVNTYGLGTTSVTSQREVIVSTSGVNADVKVQATGTNSKVRFSGDGGIELSDATTVQDNLNVTGNLTVSGNITANGSQFIVNATTVTTKDNIITVNSGEVGSGVTAGKAGIQVDRGDAADYQLV